MLCIRSFAYPELALHNDNGLIRIDLMIDDNS